MDDKTRRVGRGDEPGGRGEELRGRSDEQARNYGTTPRRGDSPDLDPDSNRRAREIQSEIAHTRAEMSETIEAIQDRLRPSNLAADAKARMKTVTNQKVKHMADTASETAQDMARDTRERAYDVIEGARQNPVPALMIGAGVAWLLIERARNKSRGYDGRGDWSEYSPAGQRGYEAGDYYQTVGEPVYSDVEGRGRLGTTSDRVTARSRHAVSDARDTARRTARRTQTQMQRMLTENPLLVGAAAVLVGAAVGASLPETERENELMGEARDSVIDRAQEAARDAAASVRDKAGAVRDVAEEAVEKARDEVTPGKS